MTAAELVERVVVAPESNPFEVIVMRGSAVLARAEAATAEDVVFAGRTLHDEALPAGVQTVGKLSVVFLANGVHVRTVEGRP